MVSVVLHGLWARAPYPVFHHGYFVRTPGSCQPVGNEDHSFSSRAIG